MNTKVRYYLIELARNKLNQTVTYQKLCDDCDLKLDMYNNPADRKIIGEILGEISIYEHSYDRPLLSSLVIRLNDGQEGDGFYKLCEKLGFGKVKNLKNRLFEFEQITKTVNYWVNNQNYIDYR